MVTIIKRSDFCKSGFDLWDSEGRPEVDVMLAFYRAFAGEHRLTIFKPMGRDHGLLVYSSSPDLMDVVAYVSLHEERKTIYVWPDIYMECHVSTSCSMYRAFHGTRYRYLNKKLPFEKECFVDSIINLFGDAWRIVFNTRARHIKSIMTAEKRRIKELPQLNRDIQHVVLEHCLPSWLPPVTTSAAAYSDIRAHAHKTVTKQQMRTVLDEYWKCNGCLANECELVMKKEECLNK